MATIKDVAREAGVSIATVSRVFNDRAVVSDDTCNIVLEVAARLNYWPNGAARSLITNQTSALGVLLPDLHGEFFSEVIRGIDLAARKEGFHLLVSSSHSDAEEMLAAIRSLRGRIDGLIAMAPGIDAAAALEGFGGREPLVLLNPGVEVAQCETLSIANYDGALAVVRYLLDLGHRRIAMIKGPDRNVDARERLRGYRAAIAEAGLNEDPRLQLAGDFSRQSGADALQALLGLAPRPTAVFAANDYMALGLLGAMREANLRAPEHFAVAGFDDIVLAQFLDPPLTTVRVDAYELGERAALRLIGRLRHERPGERLHEVLRTKLIVRKSCGSPVARSGGARPASSKEVT